MAKANESPLTFGQIIDRIEQMREEMLMLQRSLEKMELAEPPAPEDGAAHGIKDVYQTVSTPSETNQKVELGSIRFRRPL